eukprot:GHVL01042855.1.p1 GENE.GHVL01042855.1~~GHVL01042855.1.p1  ORF type:complete len:411 (-),score=136.05 GHVL01042855.1:23-1255(-)
MESFLNSTNLKILKKIFNKKIKTFQEACNSEDSESDEESDESDDICPQGCSTIEFESTIALRDKRINTQLALSSAAEVIEISKMKIINSSNKLKDIENLEKLNYDKIQQFQIMKLNKLNLIETAVSLITNQIIMDISNDNNNKTTRGGGNEKTPRGGGNEKTPRGGGNEKTPRGGGNLTSFKTLLGNEKSPRGVRNEKTPRGVGNEKTPRGKLILPPNLDNRLLIDCSRLTQLQNRTSELNEEIKNLKNIYSDLKKKYSEKVSEKKNAENELQNSKLKLEEIQLLKFGKVTDINLLEKTAEREMHIVPDIGTERLTDHADQQVRQKKIELKKIEEEFSAVTRENTDLMSQIVTLGGISAVHERQFANTLHVDKNADQMKMEEKQKLKKLLLLHQTELAALKHEILLLKIK